MKKYHITNIHEVFDSGTNKPILASGIDDNGDREKVVIKLMASERMNGQASAKEVIGACLALELGLNTATPSISLITDELVEANKGTNYYQRLFNSIGLNYSCEYISPLEVIGTQSNIHRSNYDMSLKVFYFDLLIQNPDRTITGGKTNLFTVNKELFILDHELAFSFVFPIIGRPNSLPYEFNDSDKQLIENHVLYRHLKGKKLNLNILDNLLDKINDVFWKNIRTSLPENWISSDIDKIENHITSIKSNHSLFIDNINTILS